MREVGREAVVARTAEGVGEREGAGEVTEGEGERWAGKGDLEGSGEDDVDVIATAAGAASVLLVFCAFRCCTALSFSLRFLGCGSMARGAEGSGRLKSQEQRVVSLCTCKHEFMFSNALTGALLTSFSPSFSARLPCHCPSHRSGEAIARRNDGVEHRSEICEKQQA